MDTLLKLLYIEYFKRDNRLFPLQPNPDRVLLQSGFSVWIKEGKWEFGIDDTIIKDNGDREIYKEK